MHGCKERRLGWLDVERCGEAVGGGEVKAESHQGPDHAEPGRTAKEFGIYYKSSGKPQAGLQQFIVF